MNLQISPEFSDILMKGAFGLSTAAIIYWLVAHARRVRLLVDRRAMFLAPGVLWLVLVMLYALAPRIGVLLLVWLAGWAYTLQFKSAAKDNERTPDQQG